MTWSVRPHTGNILVIIWVLKNCGLSELHNPSLLVTGPVGTLRDDCISDRKRFELAWTAVPVVDFQWSANALFSSVRFAVRHQNRISGSVWAADKPLVKMGSPCSMQIRKSWHVVQPLFRDSFLFSFPRFTSLVHYSLDTNYFVVAFAQYIYIYIISDRSSLNSASSETCYPG